MKKFLIVAAILAVCGLAQASMEALTFEATGVTTVNVTNSRSYTVRGTLEGVYVDAPANGATGVLTVASGEMTLFTMTTAVDGYYPVRIPVYTTAGAAATFNTYSATNMAAGATAAQAQAWYDKAVMAGLVTFTVVGGPGTGTNWAVRLLYEP